MKHLTAWLLTLAAFWLLLSGMFQPLLLIFGLLSVLLVLYVITRMDKIDREPESVALSFYYVSYVIWLLGQIVISSSQVVKIIWARKIEVNPALAVLEFDPELKGGRVLYANSVTLTPGTLSVDLNDHSITVHALNAQSIVDLKEGEMQQRIIKARN